MKFLTSRLQLLWGYVHTFIFKYFKTNITLSYTSQVTVDSSITIFRPTWSRTKTENCVDRRTERTNPLFLIGIKKKENNDFFRYSQMTSTPFTQKTSLIIFKKIYIHVNSIILNLPIKQYVIVKLVIHPTKKRIFCFFPHILLYIIESHIHVAHLTVLYVCFLISSPNIT